MERFKWLLLMDLDGTMWDHKDISRLDPPFHRVSEEVISDSRGIYVRLNRDMLKLVKWARDNGALISTLSWNIPEKAIEAIKAFGIMEYFDYLTIEDTDRKDLMLSKLLNKIEASLGKRFKPGEIVYIDDNDFHIDDIYRNIGKVHFLQIGVDIIGFEDARDKILELLRDVI